MLAIPTYLDNSCGFLGCSRDWTPVAIYYGIILGVWPGAVIGLIVGVGCLNKSQGTGAGALVGLIILIILLGMGATGDAQVIAWGIASIPAGALVGLIVSALVQIISISKDNL